MPGDDADFAAYLAARWPSVVRTLVLLGASRADAESVARTALARCHDSWERVRREDDVDAHVYGEVLDRWRHHPADPGPHALIEDDLRRALEVELAKVTVEQREALVLTYVGELSEQQVADVLGVPVSTVRERVADGLAAIDLTTLGELLT